MSLANEEIAALFDQVADLLEIESASPFRVRAYRTAASILRGLGREVSEMVAAGEDLTELPGIGKDLAGKIRQAMETGSLPLLEELHRQVPPGLEALLRLPGLGPRRVKALHELLGIADLEGLRAAVEAGRVRQLHGFGAKTEERLREALAARREKKQRIPRAAAVATAEALLAHLRRAPGIGRVALAGSYRRGRDSVGDLDLLATAELPAPVLAHFLAFPRAVEQAAHGTTRAALRLDDGLQVDLRVVAPESFGAALHYFTGSRAHNIQVRRLGQQLGLKVNEYGVFRGAERVAGETEDSVFAAVGLPFIEPELREDQGEIAAAQAGQLPRLVRLEDLRGDLHCHTTASDGEASLRAMALAARARGLEYLAVTEHTRYVDPVRGLDGRRLLEQAEAIDRLNQELGGFTLLKGVEVDILEDGRLALEDAVLARLDLVIGSVHTATHLSARRQTERLLRALDNRYLTLLGHPGGRMLPERESIPLDMARVIRRARERGRFLELDSQPKRLDLNDVYCRLAREEGVLVAVDSDAHRESDFDNLRLGITQARRGWLEPQHVLNTRPLAQLRALIAR